MQRALDHLVDYFLNYDRVLTAVYRKLSLTDLITDLSRCRVNLLIVGRSYTWLINAKTGHPHHFVGTMKRFGLTHCANSDFTWERIENFVQKFAAVGSTIFVHSLHRMNSRTVPLLQLLKNEETHF